MKYYRTNPNLIAGETHVEVIIERGLGQQGAKTRRFHVVLTEKGEAFEVCKLRF